MPLHIPWGHLPKRVSELPNLQTMSLTNFLKLPAIDRQLEALIRFPTDLTFGERPKVPPLSPRRSLIGTAFDYLFRFRLELANKLALPRVWVAEEGLLRLASRTHYGRNGTRQFALAFELLDRAKIAHIAYLANGNVTNDLLKSVIYLAHIDLMVRSKSTRREFGVVYAKDMEELDLLYQLVPIESFAFKNYCFLNPTFGQASTKVHGADADLVIDDLLIEIKTSSRPEFARSYVKQLIGYYVLSVIGGIDNGPVGVKIERVGVYAARYGKLLVVSLRDVLPPQGRRKIVDLFLTNFGTWTGKRDITEFGGPE